MKQGHCIQWQLLKSTYWASGSAGHDSATFSSIPHSPHWSTLGHTRVKTTELEYVESAMCEIHPCDLEARFKPTDRLMALLKPKQEGVGPSAWCEIPILAIAGCLRRFRLQFQLDTAFISSELCKVTCFTTQKGCHIPAHRWQQLSSGRSCTRLGNSRAPAFRGCLPVCMVCDAAWWELVLQSNQKT